MRILKIGHNASMRGEGISLHEAIQSSNYVNIRKEIGIENLIPLIQENPSVIEEWMMYSEDKRTDGGFALLREIVEKEQSAIQHKLTAKYVLKELDFWATT